MEVFTSLYCILYSLLYYIVYVRCSFVNLHSFFLLLIVDILCVCYLVIVQIKMTLQNNTTTKKSTHKTTNYNM